MHMFSYIRNVFLKLLTSLFKSLSDSHPVRLLAPAALV
jgi:hypothetical protein